MAAKTKGYKFATLKKQAEEKAGKTAKGPKPTPFVLEDVQPPISINPPDEKRALEISEYVGSDGTFHMAYARPLLRALCGDQFGRVWALIPDDDDSAGVLITDLVQAMFEHFNTSLKDAREAAELPGGSAGS